jgi:hypothetical protein
MDATRFRHHYTDLSEPVEVVSRGRYVGTYLPAPGLGLGKGNAILMNSGEPGDPTWRTRGGSARAEEWEDVAAALDAIEDVLDEACVTCGRKKPGPPRRRTW